MINNKLHVLAREWDKHRYRPICPLYKHRSIAFKCRMNRYKFTCRVIPTNVDIWFLLIKRLFFSQGSDNDLLEKL